jgi:flagellar hook protein FlgE
MYGRLEFDNQGNVKQFYETYRVDPDTGALVQIVNESGTPVTDPEDGFEVIGAHGYPILLTDFLGLNLDNDPAQTDEEQIAARKDIQNVELNFGYYYKDGAWRSESVRTTQYATSNSTIFYDQDGYGPGYLESISVDTEGVITGHYSNGRVIPLWMVGLANFNAPEMLDKAGGNLFRETTHSGPPVTGKPGTNGLGSIAPNSLEQSNVDLGEQFVKMITIQRGFQADARTITVTDAMLEELINLKR